MPYVSDAQRKYFNAVLKKEDPDMVKEFNKESKGMKLPKYKKPKNGYSRLKKHLKMEDGE